MNDNVSSRFVYLTFAVAKPSNIAYLQAFERRLRLRQFFPFFPQFLALSHALAINLKIATLALRT